MIDNDMEKKAQKVILWFASFIPFIIAAILFVFCFILDTKIWLYVVCAVVFSVFVLCYICMCRQIATEDGYTLVQAVQFYGACQKEQITERKMNALREFATKFDYAKGLDCDALLRLYQTGKALYSYFNPDRRI